jgi:hypothetical protein
MVLNNAIKDIDASRFMGDRELYGPLQRLEDSTSFPIDLFYWNRESRRVYVIEKDLQELLAQGTYPDQKWTELKWPLDYFLITLSQPMLGEDRLGTWVKYDTIFATRVFDGRNEMISMRIFREPEKNPRRERYLSKFRKAEKCFLRGEYDRGLDLYLRGVKNFDRETHTRQGWRYIHLYQNMVQTSRLDISSDPRVRVDPEFFLAQISPNHPKHQGLTEADFEEHAERLSIFVRLLVGTCLYINSMSPPPRPRPLPRPLGYRGVTGIITNADHICDVIGKGVLDPVVYGLSAGRERASPLFVRPHARRGFWRRPAGSPPNAPKTIWVPHTIVRRDLIPEYGLMSGTETTIKSDE